MPKIFIFGIRGRHRNRRTEIVRRVIVTKVKCSQRIVVVGVGDSCRMILIYTIWTGYISFRIENRGRIWGDLFPVGRYWVLKRLFTKCRAVFLLQECKSGTLSGQVFIGLVYNSLLNYSLTFIRKPRSWLSQLYHKRPV